MIPMFIHDYQLMLLWWDISLELIHIYANNSQHIIQNSVAWAGKKKSSESHRMFTTNRNLHQMSFVRISHGLWIFYLNQLTRNKSDQRMSMFQLNELNEHDSISSVKAKLVVFIKTLKGYTFPTWTNYVECASYLYDWIHFWPITIQIHLKYNFL